MLQIAVIGMGLIGTSLAGAIRTAAQPVPPFDAVQIRGYDPNAAMLHEARGRLAIDVPAKTVAEAVHGAQLVILATPVGALPTVMAQLAPVLAADAVVTDVASTKAQVLAWAQELLPPQTAFVGGHPMAGKSQHGAHAADYTLFKEAIYCLTPAAHTPTAAVTLVEAMVATIGAKVYYLDPAEHDSYVAAISHMPFLTAALLVELARRSPAWRELALLAATGFRDTTRLASGDVTMHRDICLSNRAALIQRIDEFALLLEETRAALAQSDADALEALFARSHAARAEWLAQRPNMRPGEEQLDPMQHLPQRNLFGLGGLLGRKRDK